MLLYPRAAASQCHTLVSVHRPRCRVQGYKPLFDQHRFEGGIEQRAGMRSPLHRLETLQCAADTFDSIVSRTETATFKHLEEQKSIARGHRVERECFAPQIPVSFDLRKCNQSWKRRRIDRHQTDQVGCVDWNFSLLLPVSDHVVDECEHEVAMTVDKLRQLL